MNSHSFFAQVKELRDAMSSLEIDKRTLSERLDEKIAQRQMVQQQLRTERDDKDQLRADLLKSQQEKEWVKGNSACVISCPHVINITIVP